MKARLVALIGAALAASLLTACATARPATPPAAARPSEADRAFGAIAERWLAETLRLNPVAATLAGEYRYNDRLPD
ncbi:MAG TPA: hypothetical protein VGB54_11700, partial [Allosphingosinicella sp.]